MATKARGRDGVVKDRATMSEKRWRRGDGREGMTKREKRAL